MQKSQINNSGQVQTSQNDNRGQMQTSQNNSGALALGVLGLGLGGAAVAYVLLKNKQSAGTGADTTADLNLQISKEDGLISSLNTQLGALQVEILRLQGLIDGQSALLETLKADTAFMKELLSNQGTALADTKKALKEAQSKTQQLEIIAKQLQTEIDRLRTEVQNQDALILSLKINMGKIEALLLASQGNIGAMESAVNGLDTSITELERIRQELAAEIGQNHPKLIEMEGYIAKANSYIISLRNALVEARRINEELMVEIASAQASIAALEQSNVNMKERLTEAQALIDSLLQTIKGLQNDLTEAQKQLAEAIRLNQEMQAKVDALIVSINTIIARNNEIRNSINDIDNRLRDLEAFMMATMAAIRDIERILREHGDATLASLQTQVLAMDSLLAGLATLCNSLISDARGLSDRIAEADDHVGRLTQEVEKLKTQISQSKQTQTRLFNEMDAISSQCDSLAMQLHHLEEECKAIVEEDARLIALINALKEDIKALVKELEHEAGKGRAYDINWAASKNGANAFGDEDRVTSQLVDWNGKQIRNGWYPYHAIDGWLATAWRGGRLHIYFGKWAGVIINHVSIIAAEPDLEDSLQILFRKTGENHPGTRYVAPLIKSTPDRTWFPGDVSIDLTNTPANGYTNEPKFDAPRPLIAYNMDIPEEITAQAMSIFFSGKRGAIYEVVATRKKSTDSEFPIIVIPPVRKPCPKGHYCIDEKTREIYGEPDIPHPMTDPGKGLAW